MKLKTVMIDQGDALATVTLNRPESLNALNEDMARDLVEVMDFLENDESTRVVVLKGAGEHFAAGGDIDFFKSIIDGSRENVRETIDPLITQVHHSIVSMRRMNKPILACVHGAVAGFGVSLMQAADLVIASNSTYLCLAYSQIGLSPDGGSSYHLPRTLGLKKATELLFLNERILADDLKALGLANWVVDQSVLESETLKIAEKLAKSATFALAQIKHLLADTYKNSLIDQLALEKKAFEASAESTDFKEGVMSFLAKKKPQFIGE